MCALFAIGCSAPSEIVVVVGVAEAPPGWLDTVRITVAEDRSFDTPMTADQRLPLSLGVSSSGTGELHAVAEALRDRAVVARQEGRMAFLPGRRLLLHLYLSPQCEGSTCDEGLTCHLDGCIGVTRTACPFEALPDNGPDIACANPMGMDAGGRDAGDGTDADARDGGDAGNDAGPIECVDELDCDDGNPCTTGRCNVGTCAFDPVPSGTDCDDGLYCNGGDRCDGGTTCLHMGNPCPSDRIMCVEATDSCVACRGNSDCEIGRDDSDPCVSPPRACMGTHLVIISYGTCSAGLCTSTPSPSDRVVEACNVLDGTSCSAFTDVCCGGTCVDISTDLASCGGCFLACAPRTGCETQRKCCN